MTISPLVLLLVIYLQDAPLGMTEPSLVLFLAQVGPGQPRYRAGHAIASPVAGGTHLDGMAFTGRVRSTHPGIYQARSESEAMWPRLRDMAAHSLALETTQ